MRLVARPFPQTLLAPWGNRGQAAAGEAVLLLHDEFTDTNGTGLASHTIAPTNTLAATWAVGVGTAEVRDNQAGFGAGLGVATIDAVTSNLSVQATVLFVPPSADNYAGVVARYMNSENYWAAYLHHEFTEVWLVEVNAGGVQVRASGPIELTLEMPIALRCSGNTLAVDVDGVEVLSYGSSFLNDQTRAGVVGRVSRVDDFKVFGI